MTCKIPILVITKIMNSDIRLKTTELHGCLWWGYAYEKDFSCLRIKNMWTDFKDDNGGQKKKMNRNSLCSPRKIR